MTGRDLVLNRYKIGIYTSCVSVGMYYGTGDDLINPKMIIGWRHLFTSRSKWQSDQREVDTTIGTQFPLPANVDKSFILLH